MADSFGEAARRFENNSRDLLRKGRERLQEEERQRARAREARERSRANRVAREQEERKVEEERRRGQEEERERLGGVWWESKIGQYRITESACLFLRKEAEKRGLRRWRDKAILDPAARGEILGQGGGRGGGAVTLRLCLPSGRTTHVTVYDYTAPHRSTGIGEKARMSLGLPPLVEVEGEGEGEGRGSTMGGEEVTMTYTRLPKGKAAILQPLHARFQKEVDNPKEVLEKALETCGTLTEGDIIVTGLGEQEEGGGHLLRVLSVTPPGGISLIETDLVVDIAPSEEAEARMREEEEQKRRKRREEEEKKREAIEAAKREERRREEAESAAKASAAVAAAQLGEEPTGGDAISLRLPDGRRLSRRFLASDPLLYIFHWVDSTGYVQRDDERKGQSFALVQPFPRKVLLREEVAEQAIADADIMGAQLLVEFR